VAVLSSEFIPLRLSLQVLAWSQLSKEPWAVRNPIRRAGGTHGSCWLWITIAVMLMTLAWSGERGYSPAAWREITVATPCLIWLMVRGAPRKERADCWEPASLGSDW